MPNKPKINLALVGELPASLVKGTVYMSPDTSGNFIKVGIDSSNVKTIFDGSVYAPKGQPIVEVASYAAVPDNELGLYKYDESIAGGTKTSHIIEVTKEEYAGGSGETFEKTTTTNNSQLSTSTFFNQFDSELQNYLQVSSVVNVYTLYYNMPFNGIRLGTGSATGSISFSLASPCEITIYKYFGYNGSSGQITSYDGASKVVADGNDYTFTADDEPIVLELGAGQHTISSFHITDPKTAGRIIITSFEFEGGSSRVIYSKNEIARVEEVTALNTKVESYNTTLTNRIVSAEHNIQNNVNNITDLSEKIGDVQIFDYAVLPQPSINYINKIAKVNDVLYQCIQVGNGVLKNFAFNVSGTSEITDANKASFIYDVGNGFGNFYDIIGLNRAYRNDGNIKLGSSNNTGAIGFEKKSGVNDVTSLVIGVKGYGNYGSTFYIEDTSGAVDHYFISDTISETLIDITSTAEYDGQLNNLYISTESTHDNDEVNDNRGIITRLIVGFGDIEYEWQKLGENDFQPLDADLTSIANISNGSVGYLRKTDVNTWSVAIPENLTSITYSDLKTLRDSSSLIPGHWYRITDYICNATDIDIFVADANLDILVCADDTSHLNENAHAARHSGDTYYNNSRVESWELKYTIDGDVSNPKGIVYWVKDEHGKEYGDSYINDIITNQEIYDMWMQTQYLPFYVEDVSGSENTLSIVKSNTGAPTLTIEKSTDGVIWETMGTTSTTAITATIPANSKLYLRCNANTWGASSYYNKISTSGNCNVGGNIMSLLNKTSFTDEDILSSEYTFSNLFYKNTKIIDASYLVLPATTLTDFCYQNMFYGCTSLTTAPELPATMLTEYCYYDMFYDCTALTTVPDLPATTLADNCCASMFQGCTSLTTAPELPATTLATSCYISMFNGCTSLTTVPELPATTLATSCYYSMFNGCTSLTTAPELPATTLANSCYQSMFQGCTSLITAPELPAETLIDNCYASMFQGCTSLTTASELPATTLATYCYSNMFYGCTDLTTAPELPATMLTNSCYYNMFNGCTSLTTAPEILPATTLTYRCYNNMFYRCTSLTTAPELSATTLADYCCQAMFQGCTALTTVPDLSATTLAIYCCQSMFQGCTSLITAPELPATTLANYCYHNMFYGCTGLTTAPELPATTLAIMCCQSMFQGCTSLTTAPELPATTLADQCYQSMFQGCTSLTTVPDLPAATLANYCCQSMFQGCTALTTAPELPATALASACYQNMFQGCIALTTAPELPATTLTSGCYQNMFQGCIALTTAPELPATTLTSGCYGSMFYGCTSLTTAPELPATTLTNNCYRQMFQDCSNISYIKAMFTTTPSITYTYNWVYGVASTGTFVKNSAAAWGDLRGSDAIPLDWTVQTAAS